MNIRRDGLCPYVRAQLGAVSLWDMLTVMAGATALGGAWPSEPVGTVGLVRYAVQLAVGCLIGFGCIGVIRIVGNGVMRRMTSDDNISIPRIKGVKAKLTALYMCAFGWLVVSGIIGFEANRLIWH